MAGARSNMNTESEAKLVDPRPKESKNLSKTDFSMKHKDGAECFEQTLDGEKRVCVIGSGGQDSNSSLTESNDQKTEAVADSREPEIPQNRDNKQDVTTGSFNAPADQNCDRPALSTSPCFTGEQVHGVGLTGATSQMKEFMTEQIYRGISHHTATPFRSTVDSLIPRSSTLRLSGAVDFLLRSIRAMPPNQRFMWLLSTSEGLLELYIPSGRGRLTKDMWPNKRIVCIVEVPHITEDKSQPFIKDKWITSADEDSSTFELKPGLEQCFHGDQARSALGKRYILKTSTRGSLPELVAKKGMIELEAESSAKHQDSRECFSEAFRKERRRSGREDFSINCIAANCSKLCSNSQGSCQCEAASSSDVSMPASLDGLDEELHDQAACRALVPLYSLPDPEEISKTSFINGDDVSPPNEFSEDNIKEVLTEIRALLPDATARHFFCLERTLRDMGVRCRNDMEHVTPVSLVSALGTDKAKIVAAHFNPVHADVSLLNILAVRVRAYKGVDELGRDKFSAACQETASTIREECKKTRDCLQEAIRTVNMCTSEIRKTSECTRKRMNEPSCSERPWADCKMEEQRSTCTENTPEPENVEEEGTNWRWFRKCISKHQGGTVARLFAFCVGNTTA